MTPEEIRTLISQGEGQRLELKRSLAELETGARAAAAMANTDGGHVLFGVRDDGAILGVQIGAQTRERVVQAITDNTDPTLYPSVEYVELDGRNVILVAAPRSEDRPHLGAYKSWGSTARTFPPGIKSTVSRLKQVGRRQRTYAAVLIFDSLSKLSVPGQVNQHILTSRWHDPNGPETR